LCYAFRGCISRAWHVMDEEEEDEEEEEEEEEVLRGCRGGPKGILMGPVGTLRGYLEVKRGIVRGTGTLPGVDFSEDGCHCNALDLVVVARFPNLVVDPPPTRGLHSGDGDTSNVSGA